MSYLESPKTYTGSDLETIFFRPMLNGPSAEELGVRVLYNMPVPTTIQMWDSAPNVLQKYTTAGWAGGNKSTKYQKTIQLGRVKAELGFSAADYFSLVYELIAASSGANMDDLTGTELEQAETTLFKRSIAEGIRATMWIGDANAATGFNTFNGFLKAIKAATAKEIIPNFAYTAANLAAPAGIIAVFEELWTSASVKIQDMKNEGNLAFFVTSDIYHLYEKYLDSRGTESSYVDAINGRKELAYHGIPVIDVRLGEYLKSSTVFDKSFGMLTDRRNLVLAVNTADFPGNEVRMWYNPDQMENRQRAVFMAGCDVLDETLITYAHKI
ncbi:MAG: hypothetical protein RRZ83_02760 [Alistipes sp.]